MLPTLGVRCIGGVKYNPMANVSEGWTILLQTHHNMNKMYILCLYIDAHKLCLTLET